MCPGNLGRARIRYAPLAAIAFSRALTMLGIVLVITLLAGIESSGCSFDRPIVSKDTPDGCKENHRVSLIVPFE